MNPKISKLCCASLITLFATSCAQGYDDEDVFSGGVSNAQLESPELTPESFAKIVNPDGTESVKVTWPVVFGAGGYLCNVSIVDDPVNPVYVIEDSIVDGTSVIFPILEETKYEVTLKTLGNEKLNNKDALEATLCAYSTLLPATTIPAGSEISSYIADLMQNAEGELAFELLGGETYTLDGNLDFGLFNVTLRGNKVTRPVVTVGAEGCITTQAGLKVKWINFDCTNATRTGLIELSATPDESISTEALGYKADQANQNGYVVNDPIIIQDCNIKNLPKSLIFGNKKSWSIRDFRVDNCVVQMNNTGSNPTLNLTGASNGLIKNLSLKNTTFYNLNTTATAYFLRYSNQSNSQPWKVFGKSDDNTTHTMVNCTFCRTFVSQNFANNMQNTNTYTYNISNNIFYEVKDIYRYIQTQSKSKTTTVGNTLFATSFTPNGNDIGGRTDGFGNPYAVEEDPGFAGATDVEFDLSREKGGVDFRPTAPIAVGNMAGDPRWYE